MKLFKGGLIYDGTGAPSFKGDILVENDRIIRIEENIEPEDGWEIIDKGEGGVPPHQTKPKHLLNHLFNL